MCVFAQQRAESTGRTSQAAVCLCVICKCKCVCVVESVCVITQQLNVTLNLKQNAPEKCSLSHWRLFCVFKAHKHTVDTVFINKDFILAGQMVNVV